MGFALSVLQISRDDFDWMLPCELVKTIKAFNENKINDFHEKCELIRLHAWMILPLKEGTSPEDLTKFPWEKKKIAKIIHGTSNTISKIKSST